MKAQQQKTTSTQQQTFDPWNLRGRLPMTPVWKDKKPVQTFEDYGFAYFYEQPNGDVLTAIPPNPPTPEAVARAQFVDKTYVWKESSKAAKPS